MTPRQKLENIADRLGASSEAFELRRLAKELDEMLDNMAESAGFDLYHISGHPARVVAARMRVCGDNLTKNLDSIVNASNLLEQGATLIEKQCDEIEKLSRETGDAVQ